MRNKIIPKLTELADLCLETAGIKKEYSDEDLVNSTLVFMEVMNNKMFDFHHDKVNQEQLGILAEEIGKYLKQTVFLATGVDLHKAVDKSGTASQNH